MNNKSLTDLGFLSKDKKAYEMIGSMDWEKTSLGSPDTWPQSLRSALSICLNSNFPIAIYWGKDLELLYNEAWSPIPGNKHPWAFGKKAIEVWPEIWSDIEPHFQKAFQGIPGGSKDALLPMQRHGYTEECYFDFTFTPIYGESGKVEGIFNAVIETTYRVINERRATLLQRLTETIKGVESSEEIFELAASVLTSAPQDVPFFYLYENTIEGPVLRAQSETASPPAWPLNEVLESGRIVTITDVVRRFEHPPKSYWPEIPSEALMIPFKTNDERIAGVIVGGISPRRKLDKEYSAFYESIANVVGGELNTFRSLIKERERAEALMQLDKAKTIFFSNISHEFRTPLTLMLGPLEEAINSPEVPANQKENLTTSWQNTLRLQKLVNSLLDFSRIEAGKLQARFQQADVAQLTRDLASSFGSAIEDSGIEYRVDIDQLAQAVSVDIDMWEKIVLNLISNAFKYTLNGSISVALHQRGDHIEFSVTDTGVGIAREHIDRIFERFYRIDQTEGRSQEGTGIGLAMVKELVSLLDGEISVQSKPGVGSSFTVRIPASIGHGNASANGTQETVQQRTRTTFMDEARKWNSSRIYGKSQGDALNNDKPRVLVADDNHDMREYIARTLSDDFDVHTATNGEDAFVMASILFPDLVISDVMMPKLDGFGLLKRLRSHLLTKNIPVIFLSARAGEEARVDGIQSGANDYLVKPFSARELIARVGNQIAIHKTRRDTENEFYRLFLQMPAHIHVFKGPEHVVEFFHPLGKVYIGRDITGMKIREALPELQGQGYFELLDGVYERGETVSIQASKAILPGSDGKPQEFYFNITYLPWLDAKENIQGVLQFTIDVTEQTKTHLKIQESEQRFRTLANSIPQIVWIAGPTGDVEYISHQWEDYTGVSAEEGRAIFSDLIHEEDVGEVRSRWRASLENKVAWTSEFRLKNVRTAEYKWFQGNTVPLRDESGNVIKWIGSAADIHSQKTVAFELESIVAQRTSELIKLNTMLVQKNDQLEKAQNFLQTVLDSSVELVMAFDVNLNFTFINKRLSFISTRTPEELIGKNLLEIDPSIKDSDSYEFLTRALKGEVVHVPARRPRVNQSLVFETFVIPLKHQGNITGVVTMQRDITNLMNLTDNLKMSNEQLRQSNEDLQQFAHVTSHDLKEPVRKIKMYGNLLTSDFAQYLPAKGLDHLSKIDKAVTRISSMIDGVLQYSIVDAADLTPEAVDLNETVKSIVDDLEIPVREFNANVEFNNLPVVTGSSTLLHQLFYNLINNSLKFRKKDVPPVIRIQASTDQRDDRFTITVQDNGIGFEQSYADHIFESFTRLNPKDKYEGTGLGLALCRKIVVRHHGAITAAGTADGAVFTISFPTSMLIEQA